MLKPDCSHLNGAWQICSILWQDGRRQRNHLGVVILEGALHSHSAIEPRALLPGEYIDKVGPAAEVQALQAANWQGEVSNSDWRDVDAGSRVHDKRQRVAAPVDVLVVGDSSWAQIHIVLLLAVQMFCVWYNKYDIDHKYNKS
eukprot:scaffold54502_cov48-Prasinocladus_malaysianus.AAC.1